MPDPTCTCGRPATYVRWGAKSRGDRYDGQRIPVCAFHWCWPDAPHPFDVHGVDGWPTATEAS